MSCFQLHLPKIKGGCQVFQDFLSIIQTSPIEFVDIDALIGNYLQIVKEQHEEDSDQNSILIILQTFLERITTELKQSLFELIKEIQGKHFIKAPRQVKSEG